MFFIVIFVCIVAIGGAAVLVGLMQPKHRGVPNRALSRREKVDLAKIAGVLPGRKEN
ncbi:MAG TPA: hypothetical protein VG943_13315 [Caulobacterales bacterium]|nr:hypothetical protein [Caulobacterales bacterium]